MREQFEKLPEIAKIIKEHDAFYCNKGEWYLCPDDDQFAEAYLDGAYYAFQEQQKKIDKAIEYLDSIEGLVWYEQIKELLK